MAPPKIKVKVKREPDLTPPPRQGLGSFKTDPDTIGASGTADSFTKPAIEPLIPDPDWKQCERDERLRRVRIKEQAVKKAVSALKKMTTSLIQHSLAIPACKPRIDKIEDILARKQEFQVMVGFLGMTGAGKSTLMNALIGCNNLLPSSSWRASTAVPTEVSYNKSMDAEKLFRAEVVYITAAEWQAELESIFEDIHASATDENNEVDEERKERIKQSFDKIKCVYPHINTRSKFESTSVEQLLEDSAVFQLLGSTQTIEKRTRLQLSDAIKSYIDSGDNTGSAHHWPLVGRVRVFVKSSILEPGIVLVDLPGNLDSNAARSAIAERYSKELSVSCVVANISRGISEKNANQAAELLEKFTKRGLQLDGLYNAESLCFVLSQTDREFDYAQYAKQYPDLGKEVAVDQKLAWKLKGEIADLQRERDLAAKAHRKNEKHVKELSAEIKKLNSRLSALSSTSCPLSSTRKRGANDDEASFPVPASAEQVELRNKLVGLEQQLSKLKDTVQSGSRDLISYSRRAASKNKILFFARSRVMVQCIQHRNELSTAAIRSDYRATLQEMGREANQDLQVFPVSATVHLRYQSTEKRHMGFPNSSDTKVSALRDWLYGTTLDDRERIAQAFLDDVDDFLASIQPWIMDKYGESKMTAELRGQWESQMESLAGDLEADLRSLTIKTETAMKHLVQENIYSIIPQVEKLAGAKAKDTAGKWTTRGLWTDSKGRDHKWNHELVHDFTTFMVKPWDATFHRQFPQEKVNYVNAAKVLIVEFAEVIANKDIFPDASDGIDILKEHILRTQHRVKNETDTAFEEMKKLIKKSHKLAVPAVKAFLEQMYEHCASESGKGHYLRNKKYIEAFMTKKGVFMHRVGKTAIKSQLDQLLDNIPSRLGQANAPILQTIREEITSFFDRNSTDGNRVSSRKVVSNAKLLLQKDILTNIDKLAKDWKLPVQTEEILDDDETEDEMGFNDELFIDLSKDDDDDDYTDGDVD
ncbi:hypothetical protein N431DRAFT_549648 [Stipitochalara longipes BDJ]|nr:hypothetical protein N431DRAFT_549648 [Stipitochalara longipes BDJ]